MVRNGGVTHATRHLHYFIIIVYQQQQMTKYCFKISGGAVSPDKKIKLLQHCE